MKTTTSKFPISNTCAPDNKLRDAAPDLLKAAKGLCDYFAFMVRDPNFKEYVDALEAIKKATE